jgi:competence protein ComEC
LYFIFSSGRLCYGAGMTEINRKKSRKARKSGMKILVATVILLAAAVVGVRIWLAAGPARLIVTFLDVGQGDSTLIQTPNGQVILLDGGPDDTVLRRLGEYLPPYQRRIDYVLYSHLHDDHTTGLVAVLSKYEVKNLVYAPSAYSSPTLTTLEQEARARHVVFAPVAGTAKINLGPNCDLALLNPAILSVPADQNNSLVARLNCAGRTFLFSGDNSAKVEKALLAFTAAGTACRQFTCDLSAAVFKASHHGSNSANSEAFLRAVQPRLMVISVGADNHFGHPHPAVLARAAALGITVRRTDQDSSVSLTSP